MKFLNMEDSHLSQFSTIVESDQNVMLEGFVVNSEKMVWASLDATSVAINSNLGIAM